MSSDPSIARKKSKTKTISQDGKENIRALSLSLKKRLFLEVVEGTEKGKIDEILSVRWVIGRTDSDMELFDSNVSRKHAVIEAISENHITIRDLASTNGTSVNGVQINSKKLSDGDIITIGSTKLRFFMWIMQR